MGSKSVSLVKLDIPNKLIVKILMIALFVFLTIKLTQVILLLFLSFILFAATKPAATYLCNKFKIPNALSIVIVYLSIIFIFGLSIYFISKPLASEIKTLSDNAPQIIENLTEKLPFLKDKINKDSLSNLTKDSFSDLSTNLKRGIDLTFSAFGLLINFISIVIISLYLYLERDVILNFIAKLFDLDKEKFISNYEKVESQLGAWVRGQLLLGLIVGTLTWIGLEIIQVKYAVPLAVLAGILEIVPIIGPIISAIPIMLVGLSISPIKALLSAILCTIIQQLENNFLVPGVMKKAVGLSPVVTLTSILIGSELLGLIGSIIAVPLAAVISVFVQVYIERRNASKILVNELPQEEA